MNLNYDILFSIELLHEYFSNHKCNDLEIIPANDCLAMFTKMNIHWRKKENGLTGLIKVNDLKEPFINIPPNIQYRKQFGKNIFRFYVALKNPLFLNYTNIELSGLRRKKFYFSNTAKNNETEVRYLTAPIKHYALNIDYVPGNLANDPATGKVFEAIKKHTSKKKTGLTDAGLWMPKGALKLSKAVKDHIIGKHYVAADMVKKNGTEDSFVAVKQHTSKTDAELEDSSLWKPFEQARTQYTTENDLVEYSSGNFDFPMSAPVNKVTITIYGFNYDVEKPAYNLPVTEAEHRNFEKPVLKVNLDLSTLQPGKYEIRINKEIKVVYFDPLLNSGTMLGVIEIFNHLDGKDDYSLLTDDEKLKNTKFRIQFANRKVLWKYTRKDSKADSISDIGENAYVFNLHGDNFVSATPIPLSEDVLKTLKLEFNTKDFRLFPLPNPQINRLATYRQDDYDYLCSELHLSY